MKSKSWSLVFLALIVVLLVVLMSSCAAPAEPQAVPNQNGGSGYDSVICYQSGHLIRFGETKVDLTIGELEVGQETVKAWVWQDTKGKTNYLTNPEMWSCWIEK